MLTLVLLLPGFCFADGISKIGSSAGTNEIQLVWNVPTNHWPPTLWIYKVVPQNFAPPVISNLMALGSFTKADRAKLEKRPAFKDEGLLFFKNKEKTRHLGISPVLGWINYKDETVEVKGTNYPQGVPNEKEAYQLALQYLRTFGIDRSQLATKGDSTELRVYREVGHHGWLDKAKGTEVDEVSLRGVFFIRRIDGIEFSGIGPLGGVYISFGNQGKIINLEIVWKGLEPFELRNTLSSEQMLDAIRRGQTRWTAPLRNPGGIKKITINEVMLFYRGSAGDSEQKFVEPFTLLATSVDYGTTNVVANLECSILSASPTSATPASKIKPTSRKEN